MHVRRSLKTHKNELADLRAAWWGVASSGAARASVSRGRPSVRLLASGRPDSDGRLPRLARRCCELSLLNLMSLFITPLSECLLLFFLFYECTRSGKCDAFTLRRVLRALLELFFRSAAICVQRRRKALPLDGLSNP